MGASKYFIGEGERNSTNFVLFLWIDRALKIANTETVFHYREDGMPVRYYFNRWNEFMERSMPLLTPGGVILGLVFPSFFVGLRPAIPYLFGCMTFSGAIKLQGRELAAVFRTPRSLLLFFLGAHLLMPLFSFLVGSLGNPDEPAFTAGFVLLFSIPTAVSGFIWNTIFRGNGALSLSLIVLDTLLAPLVVPRTVALLMGTSVVIDMGGLTLSLVSMVVIPTILGVLAHELSRGEVPRFMGPYLNPFAKLFLILVVAANSAAVAPSLKVTDPAVYRIAFLALVLGFCGFWLGSFLARLGKLPADQQRTLVFSVGLRNISAAATLAIAFFPEKAALPAIIGMVFQQSMASVAGRLLLGKPTAFSDSSAEGQDPIRSVSTHNNP
ncbi:MAG TPA: bile acid:sodium symporter family protein [Termitinemataceae bacterium]|nr:bile acid:sodium symporter family protein [Termitinemataceae bacterium]HPQ01250.1 bile acid:sodium symporter family protein [Termitinemataceae bacterium]